MLGNTEPRHVLDRLADFRLGEGLQAVGVQELAVDLE